MAGQIVTYPFSTRSPEIQNLFPSIFTFVGNPHTVASVCKAWNSFLTKKDNSNFCTQWCLQLAYTHGYVNNKAVDLKKMRELLDKDYGICNVSLEVAGDAERVKIIWQQYLVRGRGLCGDPLFDELARSSFQKSQLQNPQDDEKEEESKLEPLGLQHCRWIDSFAYHKYLESVLTEASLKTFGSSQKEQVKRIFSNILEIKVYICFLNDYFFITHIDGGMDFLKGDNRDDFQSQYSFLRSNKSEVISWIKKQEIERLEIRDNRLIYLSHLIKHFPQLKTLVLASAFSSLKCTKLGEK